ncbi:MAG: hypothetical protein DI613_09795 [Kocuria rhizophila]|uniref:hypothetical protein n=1 Tax=Kocuria carniphila TaxID=262208 RepID=UPI000DB675A5|nr:MAG: hypothetical protein DI613_09795 [Kocuria rhizophila]
MERVIITEQRDIGVTGTGPTLRDAMKEAMRLLQLEKNYVIDHNDNYVFHRVYRDQFICHTVTMDHQVTMGEKEDAAVTIVASVEVRQYISDDGGRPSSHE